MMDHISERKYEVLKRLDKEVDSLAALRELTNRSSAVSRGMVTILDSFEHRLAKLETTILPVYQQTGNLQRRHHNIEKTLASLDHVLSFYNAAGETEAIIRGGHPGEGSGGVQGYLSAMDKLAASCQYFKTHNPHSVELSNVTTLFDAGSEALSREFRDELKKHQRPLNPMVTLDLVALEGEELSEEALSSIELIPAAAREDLCLVAAWLDHHSHSDKITVYAKIRGQTLLQSLQSLRDHQRSSSVERGGIRGLAAAAATPTGGNSLTPSMLSSASGSNNSPAPALRSRITSKLDTTPKSRHNKLTNMLERKSNWMIQRAIKGRAGLLSAGSSPAMGSPYSPYSATPTGLSSSPAGGGAGEEALDDSEVMLYITQVSGVARLGLVEQRLLQQIVPVPRHTTTLETLLRTPIEQLAAEGEHVSNCGLRSMQRGDTSSVLSLLTILRHLSQSHSEYCRLLRDCHTSLMARYTAIAIALQNTVVQCLESVVESVRSDGADRALPKDGTVHQQTSNTLIFVQQLQEYTSSLGTILVGDAGLRSTACVLQPKNGDQLSFEQSQALLSAYIKRVLSNLGLSIVQRSEAYSDATLRAVFRLNNYNYLLSTLMTTGLMATLELVETSARSNYHDLILQQKQKYSQSWSALLHYINSQDEPLTSNLTAGRIRDRDRQIIKDKFAGFNKEIDEMQRTQRSYSLPDRKLRDSIKRDNKEYILPKYQAFYDRYSNVPFSRNVEKYVKHTPADVSSIMDKFFDVAA